MADDIARLGYEIDSSQAAKAAADLDRMNEAAGRAAGSADRLMKASNGIAEANKAQFFSATQLANVQRIVKREYLATSTAATKLGQANRIAAAHSTNLLFQFQDIGMMLAAGQNPLMLAMQQGTQVAGVFHQMKASGQSAFSGIKAGLMGLVSPMSLMTIGVIAGGAALGQWAISALSAGEEADALAKKLKEVEENSKSLNDELRGMRLGVTADELVIMDAIAAQIERVARAEELRDLNRGRGQEVYENELRAEREKLSELEKQLALIRVLQSQKERLLSATRDLADAEREIWATTEKTSKEAEALVKDIGMAATRALVLAGVDITTPISDANKEAAKLAALYGIALEAAISLKNLRDSMEYSGRGGDPRDFGDPTNRDPNEGTGSLSQSTLDMIHSAVGRRRGGSSRISQRERELERLIQSLMTEREILEKWRTEQLELLEQYNDKELEVIGGQVDAKLRIEREYQEKMARLKQQERSHTLGIYSNIFGNMAQIFEAGGKKTFAIAKAFSVAQGLINSYRAYTEVLADPSLIGQPWLRTILAASTLGAGLAQVANIASTSFGGGSGGGAGGGSSAPTSVSAPVQQDPERVVRISVQGERWMRDLVEGLLTQIYEATEDGTRVVVQR